MLAFLEVVVIVCSIFQVMDNGSVKEFASPYHLLRIQNSRFQLYKMVKTGPEASHKLHQMTLMLTAGGTRKRVCPEAIQ